MDSIMQESPSRDFMFNLPLRVALPPVQNDSTDSNINLTHMDKTLSKELNISSVSDDTKETQSPSTVPSDKRNNNEETDGSISMTSSEKQEWSVTLYDVDRKGNVSEEDLARLVTMLYKAAGSSITVPPEGSGTKKIKLRLSVAPDQNHTKVLIQKPGNKPSCGGEGDSPPPQPSTSSQPSSTSKKKPKVRHNPPMAAAPLPADEAAGNHTTQIDGKENVVRGQGHARQHTHRKRTKKRSSRTRSADKHPSKAAGGGPVMENMDRRQYYKDLVGIENETLQSLELSEEKPSQNVHNNSHRESQGHPFKYNKSQTVFLPPQPNKEKEKSGKQVHFQRGHGGYVNNGFVSGYSHHHHQHGSKQSSKSKANRSRPKSCPIGGREENDIDSNKNEQPFAGVYGNVEGDFKGYKVNFNTSTPVRPPHKKSPQASKPTAETTAETVSPHYMRRHRNREEEYKRSMKQVAEWIQRQHDLSAGHFTVSDQQPVVLHHEHHHIHEHHHHYHFYHYYET